MSTPDPTLSVDQLLRLKATFEDLSARLSEIAVHPGAQDVAMGLNQSIPSLINIGDRLSEDLLDPLAYAIEQAIENGENTIEQIVARIEGAVEDAQGQIAQVVAMLEEMASGREVMWFEFDLDTSASLLDYQVDFAQNPTAVGTSLYDQGLRLTGDTEANVEVGIGGHVRIGLDLNDSTPVDQAVLIDLQGWSISARADAAIDDVGATFGVLDVAPSTTTLEMAINVPITLVLGTDSYMDWGSFNTRSIETLFSLETGDVDGAGDEPDIVLTIPFDLRVAGFDQVTAGMEVRVVAQNAFDPDSYTIEWPTLTINGEEFDFERFKDMSLNDLGTLLNEFERTMPQWFENMEVPGLGRDIGEVVNFARKVEDFVQQFRDEDGNLNFNGIQEFIERLESAVRLEDGSLIVDTELRWSETVDALEWDFGWTGSYTEVVNGDVAAGVGEFLPLTVSANGQATFEGDFTVSGTMGVALTSDANMVTLDGSSQLNALNSGFGLTTTGLLEGHADISFSLANGQTLDFDLNDIVGLGSTATVDDLLNLINSDDGGGGGSSRITASLVDNRLVLVDNTTGDGVFAVAAPSATYTITPDYADPESTDFDHEYTSVSVAPLVLGLWGATAATAEDGSQVITSNTLASVSPLDRIYIKESSDPLLNVNVRGETRVNGGAALGALSLSLVDGELRTDASWDVDVVDTGVGAADGRLFISEWLAGDFTDVFEQSFEAPALDGVWQFQLQPDAVATAFDIDNALYSSNPIDAHYDDPTYTENIPYLYLSASTDGTIEAGPSEKLTAILNSDFEGLSLEDLPAILNEVFQSLSQTDFWNFPLPLINKTLGDILGQLPDLGRYYDTELPTWNTNLSDTIDSIDWSGLPDLEATFDQLKLDFDDLATDWASDRPATESEGWDGGFLVRVEDWLLQWDIAIGELSELRTEGEFSTPELQNLWELAIEFGEFWQHTPPRIENYDWQQIAFELPDFGQWFDPTGAEDPSQWGLADWNERLEAEISLFWEQLSTEYPDFPGLADTFEQLQWELGRLALAWESAETEAWEWTSAFIERVAVWRGNLEGALERLQGLEIPDLEEFEGFVLQMAEHFASVPMGLQDFGWWIESLLPRIPGVNIDVSAMVVDWTDPTAAAPSLDFDITFALGEEGDPLRYAYDLESLDLASLSAGGVDVLNFTSTGDLALMLNGEFSTRFGFDLESMTAEFDPADLNANLALQLTSDDLEMGVSLGGLAGASIGDVDAGDPASITLGASDDISEAATLIYNGADGLSLDAQFDAYMPVYVNPTLSPIAVGGVVTLQASAVATLDDGAFDFNPELEVTAGNFDDLFDLGSMGLSAWIDGAIMFIDGLAYTLESDLVSALPFVPEKDFDAPGTFLGEFRAVLETARELNSLEGLGTAFSDLFDSSATWSGSVDFVLDGTTLVEGDELLTLSLDALLADAHSLVLDFNIDALELTQIATGSVDLGLDGLGIEFSGNAGLDVALALGFDLGFGYDFDTGGFEVVASAQDEITAELAMGLQEDSNAKLALGSLEFELTDGRAGAIYDETAGAIDVDASELYASFAMDLGEGPLAFSSFDAFTENLDLSGSVLAALDLDLTSNVGLGVELMTGFYDTGVTPVTFSLNPGDDFGTNLPSEYFNFNIDNTYFSLENLVGGPVLELLDRVQTAFEPLMPVIDMITSEVPLVSSLSKKMGNGEVTYLDAISWFGEGAENAVTFVEFLADTVALADEITSLINTGSDGGEPKLYLGGFSAPDDQAPSDIASADALAFTEQDPAQAGEDAADAGVLDRLNQIFAGVGMNVPLLSNPSAQLGQLLFGGEVDLITWDVPDLQASFDFRQSFPVFPPLYVSLFGGVAFETNFDLGYDTRGIRLAMADGGSASDLLNGVFLVDDNHADYWVASGDETAYSSTIGDAEMGMAAEIGAGAELNVVVAKAGVEGGLRGNLLADLADPDPDGKVYLDEFASNLVRGPQCIFDFSGALNVFLEAFIKVGIDTPFGFVTLFKDRFELAKATILEWGSVSCPPVEPSLGQLSGDVLTLNMGDRAGLVLDDGSIEDGDEVFVIDVIRNDDGSVVVGAGSGLVVAAYNFTQEFVGVTRVEFDAGIGNDTVIFTPEVTVDVVGAGGEGDDNLVGGSGNNELRGDAGSDVITGRAGDDTLEGGTGDDIIYGFGGRDSIDGGAGDDQLFGDDDLGDLDAFAASNPDFNAGGSADDNRDTIIGGDGDDIIVAGDDADFVDAGDGDDAVAAGDGDDTVEGGRGNDQILGEGGRDTLYGDDEAGEIANGDEVTHADKIQGGDGADRIFGGTGNDLLYAVDEDVLETGSVSGALLVGGWASHIEGGDGADTIYATNENDFVKGGDGADYIALGEGNNWAYGGKSSDALIDGSGNSTLLGGTGDDVFDGGEGADYIEGGIGDDQIYGREGQDTIWGGTTNNDIMPGTVTLSHYDLIVAEGVSDTSQFGFRTTLQADSCAPEIQFAPPVYPEATGPVTIQIYHDADWDSQRGVGEALIEDERWHINLWSVNAAGAYVEQVDFAQGIESGAITLASNALMLGDYVAELTPMQASDWSPTNGLATYRQSFTIDSLTDPLPVLTFGFSKRADLTGTVTKGETKAVAQDEVVFLDTDGDWQRDAGEQYAYTDANGDYVFSELIVGQDYNVVLELSDAECARLSHPASGNEGYTTVTITSDGATADFEMLPVTIPAVSAVGLAASSRGAQIDWIDDGPNQLVPIESATAYDQLVVSMCGIDLAQEALQLGPVLVYDYQQLQELGASVSPLSATQSINASGDIVLNFTQSLGAGGYVVLVNDNIFLDKGLDKEITLDGEWDDGDDRFVSGDGVAGGDFSFIFQIAGEDKAVVVEGKGDESPAAAGLAFAAAVESPAAASTTSPGSTATITGTLWLDSDLDTQAHHRMQSGEPVLGDTGVTLVTKDGVAIANTITNTQGQFFFDNVVAGEYRVELTDTDQWSTTSLTSSVIGEEWLVARYFGTGTTAVVYGNALDLVDIEKAGILQTVTLPSDKVVDKTPVMVRDVAAIGSNVYTSYEWDNGGKPAGALMLTNTEDSSVTKPIWSTELGGVYVGLDALNETTLLGVTNEGVVKMIDTATLKQQTTGALEEIATKTTWLPVGDVTVVSQTQAYAVVVPNTAGASSTQYLATFNPQNAQLAGTPIAISAQEGQDFGKFLGMEWFDGTLTLMDEFGFAYVLNPVSGDLVERSLAPSASMLAGGLSAQSYEDMSTGIIRVSDNEDATVGVGVMSELVTVWEDGDDTIDGGCGDESDLLMGDDSDQLPGVAAGSLVLEGGRDNIRGRGGDDTIEGGLQGDVLAGDAGNDVVTGGQTGANRITGGDGNDTLTGGEADDRILGGAGDDELDGMAGQDALYGGAGADTIGGGDGDDLLVGGDGVDQLSGGDDDDTLIVAMSALGGEFALSDDADAVGSYDGGAGNDQIVVSVPTADTAQTITVTPDGATNDGGITLNGTSGIDYSSIESAYLEGGSAGDTIDAGGFAGETYMHGHDGNDTLTGGAGSDVMMGGDGADDMFGNDGKDVMDGGAGTDLLEGGDGADDLFGGADNDTLNGHAGDDTLDGGAGDDALAGGANNDTLISTAGDNTLDGGIDDDTYVLVEGTGQATVMDSNGKDTLDAHGMSSDLVLTVDGTDGDVTLIVADGEGWGTGQVVFDSDASGPAIVEVVALGSGDDWIIGPNAVPPVTIMVDGGAGDNGLDMQASAVGVEVDLQDGHATGFDAIKNITNVIGTDQADLFIGNDADNHFVGVNGADSVDGAGGHDAFILGYGPSMADTSGFEVTVSGADLTIDDGSGAGPVAVVLEKVEGVFGTSAADHFVISSDSTEGWMIGGTWQDTPPPAIGPDDGVSGTLAADFEATSEDINTLDYSGYGDRAVVNLDTGVASGTGGVYHFQKVIGSAQSDVILGTNHADYLAGGADGDGLFGADGADYFVGGEGDDLLLGGDGIDTAQYSGTAEDYEIKLTDDGLGFTVKGGGFTDVLYSIEYLVFEDDLSVPVLIDDLVDTPVTPVLQNLTLDGLFEQKQAVGAKFDIEKGIDEDALSYTWFADGIEIAGQDGATLTLSQAQVGKTISLEVSYVNSEATSRLDSFGLPVESSPEQVFYVESDTVVANVNDAPTGRPGLVAEGDLLVDGVTLYATTDEIKDLDGIASKFAYQWYSMTAEGEKQLITGAKTKELTLSTQEIGKSISVTVSYTDGGETVETVSSDRTDPVGSSTGEASGTLLLGGDVEQGGVVTVKVLDLFDPNGIEEVYAVWEVSKDGVDWKQITEPMPVNKPFDLPESQSLVGLFLRATVVVVDGKGQQDRITTDSAKILNTNDLPTGEVSVRGEAKVGELLSATNTLDDDDGMGTVSYQWFASDDASSIGTAIVGATSSAYTVREADVAKLISVRASYTDRDGTVESVDSPQTMAVVSVEDKSDDPVIQVSKQSFKGGSAKTLITKTGKRTDEFESDENDSGSPVSFSLIESGAYSGGVTATLPSKTKLSVIQTATPTDPADFVFDKLTTEFDRTRFDETVLESVEKTVLPNLERTGGLIVRSIKLSSVVDQSPADASAPVVISGGTSSQVGSESEVFVIDTSSLPGGATLQLDNIEVAAIVGDATVTGGAGSNIAFGDSGAQFMRLGEDDDTLYGGGGNDTIGSVGGNDLIFGDQGDDTLSDGIGSNILDGGEGFDVAIFEGSFADYRVDYGIGLITVRSVADHKNVDTLVRIEEMQFADQTINVADLAADEFTTLEGQRKSVATLALSSPVEGQADTGVVYTVTSLPTNGALWLDVNKNYDLDVGEKLAVSSTFAQADLDQSRVMYSHDGSETTSDSFGYTAAFETPDKTFDLGSGELTISVTPVDDPPLGDVIVSGLAKQGETLTASNTLTDVEGIVGEIAYTWLANGQAIDGATGTTYVLTQDEVGKAISLEAQYIDGNGSQTSVSGPETEQVANVNDDPTGKLTVTGTAKVGETLAITSTVADIDGLGQFSYQWLADGSAIAGATSSTFAPTTAQVGKIVSVTASYTDGQGTAESVSSSATAKVEPDVETVTVQAQSQAVESVGYTPDGESLVIKVNGESQIVGLGEQLSFSDRSVMADEFGRGYEATPVFATVVNNQTEYVLPDRFSGPPSLNLDYQLIDDTENAVVTGSDQNDFIKVANANSVGKAVDAGAGDDVIDGGVGSAFVTGGAGSNTFFLDGRADGVSWSTITDFKLGVDKATVWGWRQGVSKVALVDPNGGAEGYKGVTFHFENLLPSDASDGQTNGSWNSLTFSGKTLADFGANSVEQLNAQIMAGSNPTFLTGVSVDDFGTHGYLYVA